MNDAGLFTEIFSGCADNIIDREATINGFSGPSIIFYYNHPESIENHADRTVKLSCDSITLIQKSSDFFFSPLIGINTGYTVVGNIGSDRFFQYTILGDTVSLAKHIAFMNRTSPILISQFTYDLTENHDRYAFYREINVSGKKINLYEKKGIS